MKNLRMKTRLLFVYMPTHSIDRVKSHARQITLDILMSLEIDIVVLVRKAELLLGNNTALDNNIRDVITDNMQISI